MATVVADTSFLFALFGDDAHTAAAQAWVRSTGRPITVTALNRYELGNALRFAVFRKVVSQADALNSLAAFEADLSTGHLQQAACDWATVVAEATQVSERYTMAGGHRSFDILHVAAARVLKAKPFLSFDANQRKLAVSLGLTVGP
jgi:predicted nucleic acid-binding protein